MTKNETKENSYNETALRSPTLLAYPSLHYIQQGTMDKLAGQTQRNRQPIIVTPQAKNNTEHQITN